MLSRGGERLGGAKVISPGDNEFAGRAIGRPLPLNRWRYVELTAEGFVCQVDRLHQHLGIVAAREIGEGFADTASWYQQAGWL